MMKFALIVVTKTLPSLAHHHLPPPQKCELLQMKKERKLS